MNRHLLLGGLGLLAALGPGPRADAGWTRPTLAPGYERAPYLQSLDGTHDRDQLLTRLQTLADDGILVIHQDAQSNSSAADTRLRLAHALDESLRALADRALLMA